MLKTKLAKKVLTKAEQKHLTEMNVHSMEAFKRTRAFQKKMKIDFPNTGEPCWDCLMIARKLKMED